MPLLNNLDGSPPQHGVNIGKACNKFGMTVLFPSVSGPS